jgi:hypothetical protein
MNKRATAAAMTISDMTAAPQPVLSGIRATGIDPLESGHTSALEERFWTRSFLHKREERTPFGGLDLGTTVSRDCMGLRPGNAYDYELCLNTIALCS